MKKKVICLAAVLVLLLGMATQAFAMAIFVRLPTAKYLTIDVEPTDTIATVKDIIAAKTGVPAEQQRLYFKGQELEAGNALRDYNIQKESTLTVEFLRADLGVESSCDIVIGGRFVEGQTAGIVYHVDISWGSMEFTYTDASRGDWNPTTHLYENATQAEWSWADGENRITVTNHSNAAVNAELGFTPSAGYEAVGGSFDCSAFPLDAAVNTTVENAPTKDVFFTPSGVLDQNTVEYTTVGMITVTIRSAE